MEKIGVGIIGCGNISAAYLRLAPMFSAFEIRAVADIDLAAARARAAEFGVRAETVADLLKAPDIGIVVNLTVPVAHFAVTRDILMSGKNVYSEKPLVLSLEEGEALRTLAGEKGLRIGSAPDTFLGAAHQQARALIDQGRIGQITSGTAHVMSRGMEHWHPNPDFFFQPGAGPILDVGPYYVTNLIQLLGPVRRVAALANSAFTSREILSDPRRGERIEVRTPTNIHALLDFASGAVVTLTASWDVAAHRHANMELYGTEGSLFVPDPNFFAGKVETAAVGDEPIEVPPWDHPFGKVNETGRDKGQANYRGAGLADMAEAILLGRAHRCSLDLALHAVDVMTGVLTSGETGRFVEMSTTCDRPAALGPSDAAQLMGERLAAE